MAGFCARVDMLEGISEKDKSEQWIAPAFAGGIRPSLARNSTLRFKSASSSCSRITRGVCGRPLREIQRSSLPDGDAESLSRELKCQDPSRFVSKQRRGGSQAALDGHMTLWASLKSGSSPFAKGGRPAALRLQVTRTLSRLVLAALSLAMIMAKPSAAVASLGQQVAQKLRSHVSQWTAISALPVVELRGGVPVGFWMQLDPIRVYVCCVLGNLLPVLPLLFALRLPYIRKLLSSAINRATNLAQDLGDENRRLIALALFVGIPLPGTGAWTGTIVAYVLSMRPLSAFVAIAAGVALSGVIMTTLCVLGWIGACIAGGVMLFVGVSWIFRSGGSQARASTTTTITSTEESSVTDDP